MSLTLQSLTVTTPRCARSLLSLIPQALTLRQAPEYPFPHAYTDAADILKHVFQQGDLHDLSNVTVGGFSAGAGLGFALVGTEELGKRIRAIVGLYPWVDVLEIPEDAKPVSSRYVPAFIPARTSLIAL